MRPRGQGKPRTGEGLEEAPEETVVSEDGNPRGHFQALSACQAVCLSPGRSAASAKVPHQV